MPICPSCRDEYEHGGCSRLDNRTDICGRCPEMEATFGLGSMRATGYVEDELRMMTWTLMNRLYQPPDPKPPVPPPDYRSTGEE